MNRDAKDSDSDSDDDSIGDDADDPIVIHRGTIASGEAVMRNGLQRDALAQEHKILCFEMEAAGALNDFPCLVIRGISDYSDSHKNDKWHGYAAAVAAAYARELFNHMPVEEVKQCKVAEKGDINTATTVIEELVQNTQQAADNSEDARLKAWLNPPDASINFVDASNLRHTGTGRWFLESDRYVSFKSTPNARLWLRGIPGCGKTVLASTVIEDLRLDDNADTAVIYFFFSFSDQVKQKLDDMLRSLIFQLSTSHTSTRLHVARLAESCQRGTQHPHTADLIRVFGEMIGQLQSVTVVLDALDECKERRELLGWITSFSTSTNQHCKFILLSRWESDIEDALASWLPPNGAITLEEEPIDEDLNAYIHYRLETEHNLKRMKSIHDEITDVLVTKACGMFRWVYCQLQELSECLDKPAMRKVLQTLPKDLNETYDRIIQNIPRTRIHNAIKLLQLLIHSERPMLLREVVDAVATNPDDEWPFAFENRVDPVDAIMGYCPSLLRITTTCVKKWYAEYISRFSDDSEEDERLADSDFEVRVTIQIAHFSVQEYLLLDREENPYRRSFGKRSANATITQLCLAYIWTAVEAEEAEEHSIPKFPFAAYAADCWLDHARIAGESEESTFKWICKAFTNNRFMRYWRRLEDDDDSEYQFSTYALYYASSYGLYRSVKHLLEAGADVNGYIIGYGTALQGACESGSIEPVRLLIDHGADLNPADGDRNALHHAAYHGHVEILLLLLESGAQVNAPDATSTSALYSACARGHVEVVQVLLERGAAVNLIGQYGTALRETIKELHWFQSQAYDPRFAKIVRMLLDHGADVNASGNGYESALLSACSGTRIDRGTVRLLLDHGGDPNVVCGDYGNALYAASMSGDLAVVEMLLQGGADANAMGGSYGTALCAAASHGHVEVMQLLLDNGADLNAQEDYYGKVLSAASQSGYTEVVKMLLQRAAGVDVADEKYGEALNIAAHYGDVEILQLLLDIGIDPNTFKGRCGFALCAASRFADIKMVEALLRKGADVNATGGKYDCALCAAACYGHIEVLRVLLDNGAVSNTQGRPYSLALQDAIENGHEEVARILFEEGAKKQLTITKASCDLRLKVRYDHNR
ncbi:hypothetical protein E4T44_01647 [Aureobasidium sp. EXF-8845]|nr:hypothetical protein E4T44_01647 [Aureobasidium sp. EXF-8845]KAI4856920.1 hypothetical protein E4T45_01605 [Aureobasidium sp. EXF-8846]